MFVNPTDEQRDVYSAVYEAHEHALSQLVAGAKLSAVYNSTKAKLEGSKYPFLAGKVGKSMGFAMGIDFRESSLLISPKTEETARKGMVFNINIGCSDLTNRDTKDAKNKKYAISIADTVLVNDGEPATILTAGKKRAKNISIFLKDDSSSDDEVEDNNDNSNKILGRGMRNTSLASSKRDHDTSENKR